MSSSNLEQLQQLQQMQQMQQTLKEISQKLECLDDIISSNKSLRRRLKTLEDRVKHLDVERYDVDQKDSENSLQSKYCVSFPMDESVWKANEELRNKTQLCPTRRKLPKKRQQEEGRVKHLGVEESGIDDDRKDLENSLNSKYCVSTFPMDESLCGFGVEQKDLENSLRSKYCVSSFHMNESLWKANESLRKKTKMCPTKRKSPEKRQQEEASSELEHRSSLDIDLEPHAIRRTKIICTIGPASRDVVTLKGLMTAGMDVARLNFSHGSHEYHLETINNIRKAAADLNLETVAIALDTKGPEIRTGVVAPAEVFLEAGRSVCLSTENRFAEKCDTDRIFVDYQSLPLAVTNNDVIFIDDGLIELKVEKIEGNDVSCKVMSGGILGSKKGVNLPGIDINLPILSEKDRTDIRFGVSQGVDLIFASFIRSGDAVHEIRQLIRHLGGEQLIIAKVENRQGLANIDSIASASDGVMVARGDLGIEIPPEKVFVAQRMITAKLNRVGKPVVWATQMLESMTSSPRPTRAEVTDVASAVQDGADCVMLSGETAKGKHPITALEMMSRICRESESCLHHHRILANLFLSRSQTLTGPEGVLGATKAHAPKTVHEEALGAAVAHAALLANAAAIVCVAPERIKSFKTSDPCDVTSAAPSVATSTAPCVATCVVTCVATCIASWRPPCPIVLVTTDSREARRSKVFRGVFATVFSPGSKEGCKKDCGPAEDKEESGVTKGIKDKEESGGAKCVNGVQEKMRWGLKFAEEQLAAPPTATFICAHDNIFFTLSPETNREMIDTNEQQE